MYSDKKSILELLALLKSFGMYHIVLCPGSRNAPIVHSLSVDEDFCCYAVTDERSAGFYAIGLAQRLDQAVAVCCTSGSAVVNLHPAVAEAYYQRVPLIVISADRPQAWIGQMDGQTLPQHGVFGSLCHYTTTLPLGESPSDHWLCNRYINEALLALERYRGPVHINIPLDEPLFDFSTPSLPASRCIKALPREAKSIQLLAGQALRPLIIIGQLAPEKAKAIEPYLMQIIPHGVIIAEHLANLPSAIGQIDTLLAVTDQAQLRLLHPDLVITLGGHIISKRLKQWLRTQPPRWHWHISDYGEVVDLFAGALSHIGLTSSFFEASIPPPTSPSQSEYQMLWHRLSSSITSPKELGFCNITATGALLQRMPTGSSLHLGNSMSVRLAQLFSLPEDVRVLCNRGVNGIEGSLSAALGYARADDCLNFVLLGDLSFFYDMNALCLPLPPTMRIVVLNNQGGGIFSALPQLPRHSCSYDHITGSHARNAKRWAEDSGLTYYSASNLYELEQAIEALCSPVSNESMLLEVHTHTDIDNNALRTYYEELKHKTDKQ